MRDPSGREIIRSRTAMSYAFEAAGHALIAREGNANSKQGDIVVWIAETLRSDKGRKDPAWTVTKKEERR